MRLVFGGGRGGIDVCLKGGRLFGNLYAKEGKGLRNENHFRRNILLFFIEMITRNGEMTSGGTAKCDGDIEEHERERESVGWRVMHQRLHKLRANLYLQ